MRADLRREQAACLARLEAAALPGLTVIRPTDPPDEKAVALAQFLAISGAEAQPILAAPDPFTAPPGVVAPPATD